MWMRLLAMNIPTAATRMGSHRYVMKSMRTSLCCCEILRFVQRPDLDVRIARHGIRAALHPFDHFLQRPGLQDPETRHQLLGLRERAVDHRALRAAEVYPHALGSGFQSVTGEHHAGLLQLGVEPAHVLE